MPSSGRLFPLENVTKRQLRHLCKVLWSWPDCEGCCNDKPCSSQGCPFKRMKRLSRFFEHYKDVIATYEPDTKHGEGVAALTCHEDLFRILVLLRTSPELTRAQTRNTLFADRQGVDEECAIDIAVKIMVMVNCSADLRSTSGLQDRVRWPNDIPFSQFVSDLFPTPTDHPRLNEDDMDIHYRPKEDDLEKGVDEVDIKGALLAKKLKKNAGLNFQPTDDLRCHLRLNKKNGVLELYHHAAFLKEHLRLTKDEPEDLSLEESLRLGALPRQLVLEILDSLQKILFPRTDKKSRKILDSLTATQGFDEDCGRYESTTIRNAKEKDIPYHYFGARLVELHEELENPTPRGIERWFQRKSGARYVMMATLVGVTIAIILGIAGLAVSSYQAWLGYQQWQHPVSPSGHK